MCARKLGSARSALATACVTIGGLWLMAGSAGAALPDGRVYEVVSPAATEGNANIYVPIAGSDYTDENGEKGGIITRRPFEVAADGQALVYAGDPPATEGGTGDAGQSNGDEYLATHVPGGGWSQVDLQPVGDFRAEYQAFSDDLSVGILSSGAPLQAGGSAGDLYSRRTPGGGYEVLVAGSAGIRYAGGNAGASGVPAMTDILLESEEALSQGEGTLEREVREDVSQRRGEGKGVSVLYELTNGQLGLVSVLPDGKPDVDAAFGVRGGFGQGEADADRAVSADGSRVFWTSLTDEGRPESLYSMDRGAGSEADTVQIDLAAAGASGSGGGGRFWTASADGSRVFFTDESQLTSSSTATAGAPDLYEYDTTAAQLTDLTVDEHQGEHANVQGMTGVSEDGSYIYFVADGALADGAAPQACEAESSGTSCNLYIRHEGTTKFIAALSSRDNGKVVPFDDEGEGQSSGDWEAAPQERTAELTPSGHSLLFMSNRSLTGYANEGLDEVFLYEYGSGELLCVSCEPGGAAPAPTKLNGFHGPIGGYFPITQSGILGDTHQPRVISEDGSRVFFVSGEPLVPQDANGWLDVYEWERDGAGGCASSRGCVHLLSGGADPENSFLLGASTSGDDVFLLTRDQFVAGDRNDNVDVYDARVGGVQPQAAAACSGTGCQGVPPAPPIFATPSSVTFEGVGNFPAPGKAAVKPKKKFKKPQRCKRGHVKKKGVCVKSSKAKDKKPGKRSR